MPATFLPIFAAANFSDSLWLKDLTAAFALLAGFLGACLSLYKIHTWTIGSTASWKKWRAGRRALRIERDSMPSMIRAVVADLSSFKSQLSTVLGSDVTLADDVAFLRLQEEHRFWLQRRVAFRCDASGSVYKISRALMELAATMSEQDLFRTGWKRMTTNEPALLREWTADWCETAKTNSPHSGELELNDLQNRPLGRWLLQISPRGLYRGVNTWEAVFHPADDVAREIATARGWAQQ